ncbi:MAG: transglutaminase-like domain-containing protein [Bacteroidia bacterium]
MEQSEIEALVKLIDDEDPMVYNHVRSKLISFGHQAYQVLHEHAMWAENEIQHERLLDVLSSLNLGHIKNLLSDWAQYRQNDLLEGIYLIAKYRFTELDLVPISQYIDKIKLDIWLRLNHKFSPLDNVRVINEVLFGKYRFYGDSKNYYNPENSYINQVLDSRKGNPISISILYSIIAQRLYLPIFGVDLPQHFILAYKDDSELKESESFNTEGVIPYNLPGEVIFYVNAFNGGAIFSKYNIDRFLKQSNLGNEEHYFEPCSNIKIVARVIRNLINSYNQLNDKKRKADMQELHEFINALTEK